MLSTTLKTQLLGVHPCFALPSLLPILVKKQPMFSLKATALRPLCASAPFHMLFPVAGGLLAFPNMDSHAALSVRLLPTPWAPGVLCDLCHGIEQTRPLSSEHRPGGAHMSQLQSLARGPQVAWAPEVTSELN